MYKTIRILTILAAMIVGAGQAWAEDGVKYIDENGTEQTCSEYTVLTGGGETTLDGGWYVVNSDITYTGKITLNGNMHLILCDGAKMNVGSSESRINDTGIDGLNITSNLTITIYGQSTGDDMGTLSIYTGGSNGWDCICSEYLTINGGHIIANTDRFRVDALFAQSDFTINGGIVEATATGTEGDAIHAGDRFHYAGGIVTTAATRYAFYANRGYNFTWRNPTDRVTIGSTGLFTPNQFTVTDGKRFVAYNDAEGPAASAVLGSTGGLAANVLAGKTLRPLAVSETVGGVTTTYPGYCLTVPAGTVVSGKTEADGKTPKPDFTIGGKPYFTYKTGDNVAFTLEDRGQDGVEVSGLPIDLAVTDRVPTIEFDMRTDDVNVTAKFYLQQKGVDYLDWDNTAKKLVRKNTKDLSPAPKVYMLDGTESVIGKDGEETWYYVDGTVDISNVVKVDGDVHIILCDGSKMTMTGTNDSAINGDNASIAIYGQSNGTVTLTTSGITAKSILAPGVTLIAEINDEKKGITVNGDVTVGSIIAETLTATDHNLTLTGTGSEIGITYLYTGTLTVNDNAGGSVGKLTAGTVIVNNGGDLTATSVTNLSSLTVKGGVLSLSEALDLSGSSITLEDGGVIRTNAGVLTVGNVSGIGTIQGKDGIVLKCGINNPNLDIVAETKDIDATVDGVTNVKSLTATDGGIIATGKDITAGTISAKGKVTAKNIKAGSGENGSSRNVTINGGKVTVESISAPNGDIILGWKAREDFIYADSYVGTVKIAEGQCFTYEGNTGDLLRGTLTADQISAIKGKIIIPVDVIFSNGGQYMLLYEDEACFKIVSSGVKTYVVSGYDLSGTPTVGITEVTGGGVPKEFPFIIGVESGTLPNIIILDLASGDEATTIQSNTSAAGALKNLFVCDGSSSVADLLAAALGSTADLGDYVLFTLVNDGFKPIIATATSTPAKGTCLLAIPKVDLLNRAQGGNDNTSGARTLSIDLGDMTGIRRPTPGPSLYGGEWYDLQGRRLSGQPTQKGVYIYGGRAVVIQ